MRIQFSWLKWIKQRPVIMLLLEVKLLLLPTINSGAALQVVLLQNLIARVSVIKRYHALGNNLCMWGGTLRCNSICRIQRYLLYQTFIENELIFLFNTPHWLNHINVENISNDWSQTICQILFPHFVTFSQLFNQTTTTRVDYNWINLQLVDCC